MDNSRTTMIPPEEIKRLNGLGFLHNRRAPGFFNARIITQNGKMTTDEHRAIAEAADRFGSGEIIITTRLSIEIQGIPYENIPGIMEFLEKHSLNTGGTGPFVHPVISCKGTSCKYRLLDSYSLSIKMQERFYTGFQDVKLPHKFKIAIGGCPNNCAKPNLNDLGIVGQCTPEIKRDLCRNCRICGVTKACPAKIAHIENEKIFIPMDQCLHCGRCRDKCPYGAISDHHEGYRIYIGGRWGRKISIGQPLTEIVETEDELMNIVEKTILLYRDQGIPGERFADTVARLGFDKVNDRLLSSIR